VLAADDLRRLVPAAAGGDQAAWNGLVDGFSGLVWSVIRGHGLFGAEAQDVSQTVWLRFVEHIGRLRDPERTAAWLATTARHECYRVLRKAGRSVAMADPPEASADDPPVDRALLASADAEVLLGALEQVRPRCQALLRLMLTDPPLSYDEIAEILDMPKGSIGPTRMRCFDHLRAVLEGYER
jgi:RNA polymerase sigma factor (sigma-70 family)